MPCLSADTTFGMALHGTGLPLLLLLSVAEFRATTAVAGRLEARAGWDMIKADWTDIFTCHMT